MDTSAIYKRLLIDECLNGAKFRRNHWGESQLQTGFETEQADAGTNSFCDLGGEDYSFYKFMMEGLNKDVRKAIINSIYEVAETTGICVDGFFTLGFRNARQYVFLDPTPAGQHLHSEPVPLGKLEMIPGMHLTVDGVPTLFVFVEPIFTEFLPSRLENTLLANPGIGRIKYVTLAEKGTPSPTLNWQERESETVQGYKTYSLEEFYDDVFGHKEWEKLEGYLKELKKRVTDYCGISIVKALLPNSIRRFSLSIDSESKNLSNNLTLTSTQRTLLDARFAHGRAYTALTGTCDFARSFKTAEWLYMSLKEACYGGDSDRQALVDLTPITSSYFKAIEQYIYDFMAIHTCEHDHVDRKLFVGFGRSEFLPSIDYRDSTEALEVERGYIAITSQLMSPPFKETLNLGLLTRFFGSKNQQGRLFTNCTDLLVGGARECGAYELIIDTLAKVTRLRNGYFHKDNLYDWDKVDEVRDTVRFAFYLLLGAYKMAHDDEIDLGFDSSASLSDTYRLCDYINHRALLVDRIRPDGSRVIPLFYCDEISEPLLAASSDSANVYDQYGNPAYDGIHFNKFRIKTGEVEQDDDRSVFFGSTALPQRLSEGFLETINPNPFQNRQSGPIKVVFKDGCFLGGLEF